MYLITEVVLYTRQTSIVEQKVAWLNINLNKLKSLFMAFLGAIKINAPSMAG